MSLFHLVHLDYLEFQPACIIAHRVIIICLIRYLCLSSLGLSGYYITLHHHLRLSFFTMITLLILPLTKLYPHSSNLSRLYHWFFSSHDLALVSLMLTTSSYLFLLFAPGISSPILVLSPLLLFSMCTHSTSGLLLILVITLSSLTWLRHITFTSLLCLKLGFMQTTRQLKYLMLFFMVSLLLAIFVLFLLHSLFCYWWWHNIHVLFCLYLQLFSNPLKCQLSLSNSLILNLLFTTFIVLHPHLKNLKLLLLQFLEDFQTLVSVASTAPHNFLIIGDFNIHVDNPSDCSAIQFLTA